MTQNCLKDTNVSIRGKSTYSIQKVCMRHKSIHKIQKLSSDTKVQMSYKHICEKYLQNVDKIQEYLKIPGLCICIYKIEKYLQVLFAVKPFRKVEVSFAFS